MQLSAPLPRAVRHSPQTHNEPELISVLAFNFKPNVSSADFAALRAEVRSFLATEIPGWSIAQRARSWMSFDREFSKKLGARGWIGMTWPLLYGGAERSALERYVVLEELLVAGAPVAAHWIADRQSGPLLLRYGSEAQRRRWLPGIARGETIFCIGMSEPDTGSDLASLRTRATRSEHGWRLNGTKVWTTLAHHAHAMIALVRTSGNHGDRQRGLSQFLVDLSAPGITVRPISDMTGEQHFSEVIFDDVSLDEGSLIGVEGEGWTQVIAELSLERSGPERYLSSFVLIEEFARRAVAADDVHAELLGQIVANLWTLRMMSTAVAAQLGTGGDPRMEATIVKDLGNSFEQSVPRLLQAAIESDLRPDFADDFGAALGVLLQLSPSFSLRGGTREMLRGIIARELGLR
jgi:alkylation response protein AidB-like acyl-CoA dehydrogenase